MQFVLATVISSAPGHCRLRLVDGGPAFTASVQNRARVQPGQLVAVNMAPTVPEVAFHWYRARSNPALVAGSPETRPSATDAASVKGE